MRKPGGPGQPDYRLRVEEVYKEWQIFVLLVCRRLSLLPIASVVSLVGFVGRLQFNRHLRRQSLSLWTWRTEKLQQCVGQG